MLMVDAPWLAKEFFMSGKLYIFSFTNRLPPGLAQSAVLAPHPSSGWRLGSGETVASPDQCPGHHGRDRAAACVNGAVCGYGFWVLGSRPDIIKIALSGPVNSYTR